MVSAGDVTGAFKIVVVACLAALAYNFFSPSGIALVGEWDRSEGVVSANAKNGVVAAQREITDIEKLKKIVQNGGKRGEESLVVDVRPEAQYREGHIPGACTIPLSRLDARIEEFFNAVSPDRKIILYCQSRECSSSHHFAETLAGFGYENVKVFSGGFREWQEKGSPVEVGDCSHGPI